MPIAGLGSRFLPATKSIPKEMLPVVDRPLIAYAVEEALQAGIREFVFVTSRSKKALEDYFDVNPEMQAELEAAGKEDLLKELRQTVCSSASYIFLRQPQPRGTGDALWRAHPVVGERPFGVMFPDELLLAKDGLPNAMTQLVRAYETHGKGAIGVMPVQNPSAYGVVALAEALAPNCSLVEGIVEKPKVNPPSNLAAVGRYVFAGGFMRHLGAIQDRVHGREVYLTDAIELACKERTMSCVTLQAQRFDCGSKLGYAQANLALALAREDFGEELCQYALALCSEIAK